MAFWNWVVGKKITPERLNAFKTAYKSTAEDRGGTTLLADADLLFAVGGNETWAFTFNLYAQCTAAGDFKLSVAFPASAAITWTAIGGGVASDTAYSNNGFDAPVSASSSRSIGMGGSPQHVIVEGTIFTGSTAGNVQLYWCMNATDGTNTASLRRGSNLFARRLE